MKVLSAIGTPNLIPVAMSLEAIKFDRTRPDAVEVKVLDQLLLPYTSKYIPIRTIDDGFTVIKTMQVRGAPAIAIVGTLSVLTEVQLLQLKSFITNQWFYDLSDWDCVRSRLLERIAFLLSSRPTAVNLFNSVKDIRQIVASSTSLKVLSHELFEYSCQLIDQDLANNMKMGNNGASFLLDALAEEGFEGDFGVLTICNTGSLATSGYGTALGVIRSLWKLSQQSSPAEGARKKAKVSPRTPRLNHVFPLETRPYNQGSRLTAYELVHDQIPTTLITDSSIAYRIKTSPLPIKAAFVGADRIVRNGDTANKIGTYQLAIVCRQFGVKFFVVAPKTTIDNVTETGDGIIVEQRKANEFRLVAGTAIDVNNEQPILSTANEPQSAKVGIAPPNVDVWNPAFDVTPHDLIDGIVTEEGVFTKSSDGKFHLDQLF